VSDNNRKDEMNKALFANIVMMLGSSAMQQLGKLMNPMTGKTEVSLEGAQITIDMLSMLKEKTKGNLDRDEDKMLTDILSSLQLNYVETAEEEAKKPASASKPEESGAEKLKEDAKPQEPIQGAPTEHHDPKYHKSYGASESKKE
jgi:hypothetical protein